MSTYLFSGCMNDPVTRGLSAFRTNRDVLGYFAAFAHLFQFSREEGVTAHTIREYCVRMLLDLPGIGGLLAIPAMAPYLERDIALLYDLYFSFDWSGWCAANDVLPPTSGMADPGHPGYRPVMEALVAASSPARLREGLTVFFRDDADRLEAMFTAMRWDGEKLHGIPHPDPITYDQLGGLSYQKRTLMRNTLVFLEDKPANDILLVGGSGTGKSSSVKATLNHFASDGLRLVELFKRGIDSMPELLRTLRAKRRRYIIYIDDLTFESADASYMGLKVALDGQVEERPRNVLVYATSNRRHLVNEGGGAQRDEFFGDNDSLAKRFGIHLSFSNLTQSEYYAVLELMLSRHGIPFGEDIARSASAWSAANGGRSGRSAKQFISQYLAR